ncbi:hypothetical protein ACFXG4_45615, partial [Nocardia sp. NPDC059246]
MTTLDDPRRAAPPPDPTPHAAHTPASHDAPIPAPCATDNTDQVPHTAHSPFDADETAPGRPSMPSTAWQP